MLKVVILSNHVSCLPVVDYLNAQGSLQAVVSTDKLRDHHTGIEDFCNSKNILFLKINRAGLLTAVKQLFTDYRPDAVIMFGFSYRIPAALYEFPPLGFYNVHFSLLPAYQGPDPLFWQMKNGETAGGVSIHRVDAGFDTGAVVMQQQLPFIPGETWGVADGRYGVLAVNMIVQLIDQLKKDKGIAELPVNTIIASYYPRPTANDLAIDWDLHTAAQIEALVNACNPGGGGAVTTFRQQLVKILEVSPVEATGEAGVAGGTIIHADGSGLYVQCMDRRILRVNVLKLSEGFVTGFKLVAMGVQKGDRLENGIFQYQQEHI
ncbi:methionyl-tRNA formyltransferase [Mucilaginibacter agri]|uniref:Methionyl-tRNA formyltransferase n=1 Tax=Mucilaginibacter agri TaxID=2695265 RepID=A0A965ZGH6_9SPHI|nr:formyltransferase family protein [Mucilaginibacter agri]NCD70235.1 hypothetical protein [Mucilaginibacter agri]